MLTVFRTKSVKLVNKKKGHQLKIIIIKHKSKEKHKYCYLITSKKIIQMLCWDWEVHMKMELWVIPNN